MYVVVRSLGVDRYIVSNFPYYLLGDYPLFHTLTGDLKRHTQPEELMDFINKYEPDEKAPTGYQDVPDGKADGKIDAKVIKTERLQKWKLDELEDDLDDNVATKMPHHAFHSARAAAEHAEQEKKKQLQEEQKGLSKKRRRELASDNLIAIRKARVRTRNLTQPSHAQLCLSCAKKPILASLMFDTATRW